MKTKIIITNGNTEIELKPENEFEETALENMENNELSAYVDSKYGMGARQGYKLMIKVKLKN